MAARAAATATTATATTGTAAPASAASSLLAPKQSILQRVGDMLHKHYLTMLPTPLVNIILSYCATISPAPAIGIDLGTSKSCVAVMYNDMVEVLTHEDNGGETFIPSCVAFTTHDDDDTDNNDDGKVTSKYEILIGDAAKNQAARNAANTIFSHQRLIGIFPLHVSNLITHLHE
jgi:hypothetical protein